MAAPDDRHAELGDGGDEPCRLRVVDYYDVAGLDCGEDPGRLRDRPLVRVSFPRPEVAPVPWSTVEAVVEPLRDRKKRWVAPDHEPVRVDPRSDGVAEQGPQHLGHPAAGRGGVNVHDASTGEPRTNDFRRVLEALHPLLADERLQPTRIERLARTSSGPAGRVIAAQPGTPEKVGGRLHRFDRFRVTALGAHGPATSKTRVPSSGSGLASSQMRIGCSRKRRCVRVACGARPRSVAASNVNGHEPSSTFLPLPAQVRRKRPSATVPLSLGGEPRAHAADGRIDYVRRPVDEYATLPLAMRLATPVRMADGRTSSSVDLPPGFVHRLCARARRTQSRPAISNTIHSHRDAQCRRNGGLPRWPDASNDGDEGRSSGRDEIGSIGASVRSKPDTGWVSTSSTSTSYHDPPRT